MQSESRTLHATCTAIRSGLPTVARTTLKLIGFSLFAFSLLFSPTVKAELANGDPAPQAKKRILFLGDSLTEGYGLEERFSYPALIAERLNKDQRSYTVVNAGIGGDTSAGGLQRLDWLLQAKVDILVLALGANDALRGMNLTLTEQNLNQIITETRKRYPAVKILLAGMMAPPNLGQEYTTQFKELFPRIATEQNVALIPFLLQGVAAEPTLNQPDGIHPNAEGYERVAQTVWKSLEPLLE